MERSVMPPGVAEAANISSMGQNARFRLAVLSLSAALFCSVFLTRAGLPMAWRLIVFIPFFLAASCALQGLYRVCPMHSREGTRESESGISIPQRDKAVGFSKRRGYWVLALSFVLAAAATGLVLGVT